MILLLSYVNVALRFKSYLQHISLTWCPKRLFSNHKDGQNLNSRYVKMLSEVLGCSIGTASLLLIKNKDILTLDLNSVRRIASFCRNNFKLSEVVELPSIMSLSPYVLNDRTSTLKELGCCTITAGNVLLFKQFMQETPDRLYKNGFLKFPEISLTQAVNQLICPTDVKLQLMLKLSNQHLNNFMLSKTKFNINAAYLAWKLECSEEKAVGILLKHSSLCTKSLVNLERVCDILLRKLELPLSKVYSLPSLLALDCDNLEELISKDPKVCGISIKQIAKKYPSIFKRPVSSLGETVSVLESHGITEAQLLACPKILNLSSSTILSRLNILVSMENSDIVKKSQKFLWLILYFSNINKNTRFMEHLKQCDSSNVHISNIMYFSETSHLNNRNSKLRDICFYLSIFFSQTVEEIRTELKQYRNICLSSAQNAQKIVEYLFAQGVTKEQLWNGIGIVLYDADIVIEYFQDFPNRGDLQQSFFEWSKHLNFVQLFIYMIERDQMFTDNGVYARSFEKDTEQGHNEDLLLEEEILALHVEGSENV